MANLFLIDYLAGHESLGSLGLDLASNHSLLLSSLASVSHSSKSACLGHYRLRLLLFALRIQFILLSVLAIAPIGRRLCLVDIALTGGAILGVVVLACAALTLGVRRLS